MDSSHRRKIGDGGRILTTSSEGGLVSEGGCGAWNQDASRGVVNEDTPERIDKATGQLDSRKTKQLNNHKCSRGAQESSGAVTGHAGSQIRAIETSLSLRVFAWITGLCER